MTAAVAPSAGTTAPGRVAPVRGLLHRFAVRAGHRTLRRSVRSFIACR